MEIVEIDPFDRGRLDAWHAVYAAAEQAGRGEHSNDWLLEEIRAAKQTADPSQRTWLYGALADGELVGAGELEVYELDNPELAWAKVYTRPDRRGEGVGTALTDHVEQQARGLGRRRMLTEVVFDYELSVQGTGSADVRFATDRGYQLGIGDVQRVQRLPVADDVLAGLIEAAAPAHRQYRVESFHGRVPDDWVSGYAELAATLNTEAPTGDLALENETSDVEIFRIREALLARQGRTRWATVAFDADDRLVGYTELMVSSLDPMRAYQWGTLVAGSARGARLGVALKARNLAAVQAAGLGVERIYTWNASVNAHMVAVNEALGYEPVARMGEFQKEL
ncbi:GNAT family N-acetyltransferase [Nocardioides sp. Bht2]|uniref:GNAT family N-acetyltransferase n=1 Tax=Nocardioides sp. Bht2 TaxID=3392297 RepID=UPI0039B5357B